MKTIYLLLALALFLPEECGDYHDGEDTGASDPAQLILGQWQEIARGNDTYPELEPNGHIIEFLPDGIYHGFWGNGNESTRRYRVDAEFLYLDSGKIPDGHTYRYTFTGTDTLRLDYVDGAITDSMDTPTFHIYKRLKTEE
jgi:hypothetical protein